MPTLIKDRRIQPDDWLVVTDEDPVPPTGSVILDWDRWILEQETLRGRSDPLGVRVNGDVPIQELGPQSKRFDLIALEFPAATDGRCYSHARVLRTRYEFRGELRATGNVLRDQLAFMERVGIDSYLLERDRSYAEQALAAFAEISVTYQAAPLDALPRIRRRTAGTEPA